MVSKAKIYLYAATIVAVASSCTVEKTIVQPDPSTHAPVRTTVDKPVTTPEEDFLRAAEDLYGQPIYVSDLELLDTAQMVCSNLDAGMSADELISLINQASDDQGSAEFLSAVTAAAIGAMCPWHMDLFDEGSGA